ncbi:MAG TPA: hypothetical protein DGO89_09550, partial [Microcoleaceae bacterium UBA9251]|nr:hypothetical protein [Microcoleaceae cyanobacterium UBA9251]
LLAMSHPLFSTNLTKRGLPFDLFTGWSFLTKLWLTNQIIKPFLGIGVIILPTMLISQVKYD